MSAILCVGAMHLATLCPQSSKYAHASMQLIVKTVQLFRRNLSRPFTRDHCEALIGAALLISYISWSDLGFLDDDDGDDERALRLEQEQLFLMSPGIVRVWFQAMPIFIDEGSVFVQLTRRDPRTNIEKTLVSRGEDPTRFVEPFMRMWDDHQPQVQVQVGVGCTPATETAHTYGLTSYAWRLLRGLETDLLSCPNGTLPSDGVCSEEKKLVRLRDTVTKLTTTQSTSLDHQTVASQQSARSSFEYIIRRMSPLLCCAALLESTADSPTVKSCAEDIEQLFYGFPILCCGPFAELMMQKDSRALAFLFHFYRAARVLLVGGRCWWASARSCVMEKAILKELEIRRLDVVEWIDRTVNAFGCV
ncbi:hypothetical protein PMAA_056940 [Talaromyces marneffei ATCC 18224]|uniref:C6 transcription factor n=1 Tax=Talaromyces marneffei (strain ATCC 18224 / CBS 334.59 / QM 7333) TaxID=441960 RepID=B6QLC8_TALMQ|nr:hypothetical protein PMAA_056940 [Talaromyces marneffei ATCC 18224]